MDFTTMISLIPPQYALAAKVAILVAVFSSGYGLAYKRVHRSWELAEQAQQIESGKILAAAVQQANTVAKDLQSFAYQAEVANRENDKKIDALNHSNAELLAASKLRVTSTPSYSSTVPKDPKGNATSKDPVAGSWLLSAEDAAALVGDATSADEIVNELRDCYGRGDAVYQQFGEIR